MATQFRNERSLDWSECRSHPRTDNEELTPEETRYAWIALIVVVAVVATVVWYFFGSEAEQAVAVNQLLSR